MGSNTFAAEGRDREERSYLLHYPSKLLVRDLYIREDLYIGSQPEVRLEFPAPAGVSPLNRNLLPDRLNTLDLWAPVEYLASGANWPNVPDAPHHSRLVQHAFSESGWDAKRFRGYRVRIVYPVPMILMGWSIPLPQER